MEEASKAAGAAESQSEKPELNADVEGHANKPKPPTTRYIARLLEVAQGTIEL